MLQSHRHGKPSQKSHAGQFSQTGVEGGYLVTVTSMYLGIRGPTWQLWGLSGNFELFKIFTVPSSK